MKKSIIQFIAIISVLLISTFCFAQPGPPNPPDDHGDSGDQSAGGGAPVAGGVGMLVVMGAAYGARKYYLNRMEQE